MDARILLDEEITPDGDRLVRAMLELRGEAPPDDDARPPLNLSLVLDRSGSMGGDKLKAARDAAARLVRRLSPRDHVSVVAYDDQVTTVAEPGTGAEQEDLAQRIQSIHAGGTTNLSGGWLRGRALVSQARATIEARAQAEAEAQAEADAQEEAKEKANPGKTADATPKPHAPSPKPVNRILLLTDGLANVGITDHDQLTGLAATAAREGVTTTTIGFGEGFAEDLLRSMADAGGGSTYYIEAADQAGDVFAEELEGLLGLAAQNVRVAITPAGGHVSHIAVRHDFPATTAGTTLICELGDLYAREPKRLLVQSLVRLDASADETPVFDLVVDADVVLSDGAMEHRTVTLPVVVSRRAGPQVGAEVRREALLLDAAEARRKAMEAEGLGDFDGAKATLREVANRLSFALPGDEEVREQADDLALMADRLDHTGAFAAADVKYMEQRSYDLMRSKRAAYEKISRVRRGRRGKEE